MNVKDPQGPRQCSNQLYHILKAFFRRLCDFQITAIYMLNQKVIFFPIRFYSQVIFMEDVEW